jgi:hypothetical protein
MISQTTNPTTFTRQDLEAMLVARAWEDDSFKAALLADPRSVIEREANRQYPGLLTFPAGLQVYLHQETPTDIHIVLPVKPDASAERELSDADLQLVAGASAESEPTFDPNKGVGCGGAGALSWRR